MKSVIAGGLCILVAGCGSTPKHTNTLIFGTTTKLAIDASQAPTGAIGVTIGYSRQEAVWMPLLANEGQNMVPSVCTSDGCRQYVGKVGDQEGAAAKNGTDTYSVMASFGGKADARAGAGGNDQPGAGGGAAVAQYFATGLAARLLAANGGAALVNTSATSADVVAAQKAIIGQEQPKVERVMANVTKKDGTIDTAKRDALVDGSGLAANSKAYLKTINDADKLRVMLSTPFSAYGKPLFDALP